MLSTVLNIDNTEWKRINMRRVEHLPAVELIHDLYSQYAFRINNIRFRNTVTIWKDGIVNSYAPISEWEQIEKVLGNRFYNLDTILIKELERLYNKDRTFVEDYIESIDLNSLGELSDYELKMIINNIQNFTLGDLYRLNFVQVEHGLTSAINRILDEQKLSRDTLSKLIVSDIPTEFQSEEIEFTKLVDKHKNDSSFKVREAVKKHFDKYAYMHSAYGEIPYTLQHYTNKLDRYIRKSAPMEKIEENIKVNHKKALATLKKINLKKLNKLVPLMIDGGKFRDNNKARLGMTMRYKFAILEEISKRTNINRDSLRFYSILELNNLLMNQTIIPENLLRERRINGVVLIRAENISFLPDVHTIQLRTIVDSIERNNSNKREHVRKQTITGICASAGKISGIARIIESSTDGDKINDGDIMVAMGTDFDLMDAIQRSGAVITEEGGLLSHASVVCRELEKPCCIGVIDATSIICDGDFIKLDAENGTIEITKHD